MEENLRILKKQMTHNRKGIKNIASIIIRKRLEKKTL